ncbi:MAG: hypothetical protein R6X34_15325 [Chloroflexota bacterium]
MTMNGPRLRTMLRQAERARNAGKLAAAEQSYREILVEAPDSTEAWLGLAELLSDPQEKETALEKALALEPDSYAAAVGLAQLRGEPLPEPVALPEAASPEPEPEEDVPPVQAIVSKPAAAQKEAADPKRETAVSRPISAEKPVDEDFELHCYRHPDRTTSLRCYNCNKPICSSCTNKTPVGYICPECKYDIEEKFFTASKLDYVIAGVVSFILALIAGAVVVRFGGGFLWVLLVFFFAGAVGSFIAKFTQRMIGRRRGRYLPHVVAGMIVLGVIIPAVPYLLAVMLGGFGALIGLLVPGIYAFIASSSAFYWMR